MAAHIKSRTVYFYIPNSGTGESGGIVWRTVKTAPDSLSGSGIKFPKQIHSRPCGLKCSRCGELAGHVRIIPTTGIKATGMILEIIDSLNSIRSPHFLTCGIQLYNVSVFSRLTTDSLIRNKIFLIDPRGPESGNRFRC